MDAADAGVVSGSLSSSSSGSGKVEEVEATGEDLSLKAQHEASLAENPRQYNEHLQVSKASA